MLYILRLAFAHVFRIVLSGPTLFVQSQVFGYSSNRGKIKKNEVKTSK